MWMSPNIEHLERAVTAARRELLLCSPYVTRHGLAATSQALPSSVEHIDIWTKMSTEDFLVGATQPDGLLEFIDSVTSSGRSVAIRASDKLHAKIILSDGSEALAGSSNLTRGGFGGNIEVMRRVTSMEIDELRELTDWIRPQLSPIDLQQFRDFVDQCLAKVGSQEVLLDLVRLEMPTPKIGPKPLVPYSQYLKRLSTSPNELDQEILEIAWNRDHNNNGGEVKYAFYGIQRFLQEYPRHTSFVAGLPEDTWFEVGDSHLDNDWRAFLRAYEAESSPSYQYSIWTLVNTYLTPSSGGRLTGGGGGNNELKRVWPSVGRLMAEQQT